MALEAQLVTSAKPERSARPTPPAAPPAVLADPRREALRDAFHLLTKNDSERTLVRREINERVDGELLDDPDQTIDIVRLLEALAEEFQIELDRSRPPNAAPAGHAFRCWPPGYDPTAPP